MITIYLLASLLVSCIIACTVITIKLRKEFSAIDETAYQEYVQSMSKV